MHILTNTFRAKNESEYSIELVGKASSDQAEVRFTEGDQILKQTLERAIKNRVAASYPGYDVNRMEISAQGMAIFYDEDGDGSYKKLIDPALCHKIPDRCQYRGLDLVALVNRYRGLYIRTTKNSLKDYIEANVFRICPAQVGMQSTFDFGAFHQRGRVNALITNLERELIGANDRDQVIQALVNAGVIQAIYGVPQIHPSLDGFLEAIDLYTTEKGPVKGIEALNARNMSQFSRWINGPKNLFARGRLISELANRFLHVVTFGLRGKHTKDISTQDQILRVLGDLEAAVVLLPGGGGRLAAGASVYEYGAPVDGKTKRTASQRPRNAGQIFKDDGTRDHVQGDLERDILIRFAARGNDTVRDLIRRGLITGLGKPFYRGLRHAREKNYLNPNAMLLEQKMHIVKALGTIESLLSNFNVDDPELEAAKILLYVLPSATIQTHYDQIIKAYKEVLKDKGFMLSRIDDQVYIDARYISSQLIRRVSRDLIYDPRRGFEERYKVENTFFGNIGGFCSRMWDARA